MGKLILSLQGARRMMRQHPAALKQATALTIATGWAIHDPAISNEDVAQRSGCEDACVAMSTTRRSEDVNW